MARQVQDNMAFLASARDPVRAVNPYTPTETVVGKTTTHLPVLGIAVLAGLVLVFEHLRRKKGR